jgi:DNA primase
LFKRVLGNSLDELPPGTRRLLGLIEAHVEARVGEAATPRERVRFTRRELREALGWGDTQLKIHLARLVSLELIWAHRGPHGSFLYELAWEGGGEESQLSGLLDPEALGAVEAEKQGYDRNRSGSETDRSGGGRGRSAH